jgi:hypothetical protein
MGPDRTQAGRPGFGVKSVVRPAEEASQGEGAVSNQRRGTGAPIQDQVRAEHRRLYQLLLDVRMAFEQGAGAAGVRQTFAALRRELEGHFDQEDRLYYAPLGEHHPELKRTFDAFAAEHVRLCGELAAITEQIERGDLEGASPAVLAMALIFERHESEEEEVLRRLDLLSADDD